MWEDEKIVAYFAVLKMPFEVCIYKRRAELFLAVSGNQSAQVAVRNELISAVRLNERK